MFRLASLKYYFNPTYLSTKKTISTTVRNNMILPETDTLTVTAPFKIDDALTGLMTNPYTYNCDDVVDLLDIKKLENGSLLMLINTSADLIMRIITTAGVASDKTLDAGTTYTGGVIDKILVTSSTYAYFAYVYSGTTITAFSNLTGTVTSAVISPTLDGSAETVNAINGFVGSEKYYTTYINDNYYSANLVAGLSYDDSTDTEGMLVIGYTTTVVALAIMGEGEDDARLDFTPVKLFDVVAIDSIPSYQILSDDGKIYSVIVDEWYNYTTPTTNMYNVKNYIDINVESNEAFIAGRNVSLEKLLRSDWNVKKVGYGSSVEFALEGVTGNTTETLSNIYMLFETLSEVVFSFGHYDSTSTWVLNGTKTIGTDFTYSEGGLAMGPYSLGTHVRLSTDFWAGLTITQTVGGIETTLLSVDGYEIINGTSVDGSISGMRMICDKIEDYTTGDTVTDLGLVRANEGKIASYKDDDDSTVNTIYVDTDDTERIGLYEHSDSVADVYSFLFGTTTGYNAVIFNKDYPEIYMTTLDTSFNRTDDSIDVDFSVETATAGYTDSDVTGTLAGDIGDLIATVLTTPQLPLVPYGLVMFGRGHKDYQRTASTPETVSITVYPSGSGYLYNRVESTLVADAGGLYTTSVVAPQLQSEGEDIDAWVDTVNLYYDPLIESMDILDNSVLMHIVTAVSMHPTIADWTSDGNYKMNGYAGMKRTGADVETGMFDNYGVTPLMVSATKQIVVNSLKIDTRIGRCIRIRVKLSKTNVAGTSVYDDFKVFYVKLMQPELFDIGGENA